MRQDLADKVLGLKDIWRRTFPPPEEPIVENSGTKNARPVLATFAISLSGTVFTAEDLLDNITVEGVPYVRTGSALDHFQRNDLAGRLIEAETKLAGSPLGQRYPNVVRLLHEAAVAVSIEPDNHHSAERCPYCNPKGYVLGPKVEISGDPVLVVTPDQHKAFSAAGLDTSRMHVSQPIPDEPVYSLVPEEELERLVAASRAVVFHLDGLIGKWADVLDELDRATEPFIDAGFGLKESGE